MINMVINQIQKVVLDKYRTYSYLPFYKKNKKQWILNGKVIDINNYKPVSTISESGE